MRGAKVNYAELSEQVSEYNESFDLPWVTGQWGAESVGQLGALSAEIARQATVIGYLNAFVFFWVTAALAIPLVFLVKRPRRPA